MHTALSYVATGIINNNSICLSIDVDYDIYEAIYVLECVSMRMSKKPLNLLIEADLIQKARDKGIVISRFLENKLQEYFTFIDAVSRIPNNERRGGDLNSCGADAPRAFQARAVPV
jgi:hypothetical protein